MKLHDRGPSHLQTRGVVGDVHTIPDGVTVRTRFDGTEIRLAKEQDPTLLVLAGLLAIVAVGVGIAGFVGDFEKVGLVISALSFGGMFALHQVHRRFRRARPQILVLRDGDLEIDGDSLAWSDITAVRRAHTGRGGGVVVVCSERERVVGGELRPSGVDWLEARLAAHREAHGPADAPSSARPRSWGGP